MNFERGEDIKNVLHLGIAKKLPEWMKDSVFDHKDYYDVWRWAMEKNKNIVFPYMVEKNGTKWYGDEIHFGMNDNNGMLWESISGKCLPAVKAILEIPHLFEKEAFNLNDGTCILPESFLRGEQKVFYRATNFGAYINLATSGMHGKREEIQEALMNYYNKYKDAV